MFVMSNLAKSSGLLPRVFRRISRSSQENTHSASLSSFIFHDIVISVPDSSYTATLGFSERSGIKFEIGLIRNHYVGRTFIDPEQEIRDLDAKVKFNAVRGVLQDKRVVVVDDSIVRGTTMKKLIQMIRSAGAKEIHLRISSPPIIAPCFYGIDMPTREELIAPQMTVKEIGRELKVDSIGYLSLKGMLSMHSLPDTDFCTACFSAKYRTRVENLNGKLALEKQVTGKNTAKATRKRRSKTKTQIKALL